MSKTETSRQLAAASNEKRLEHLALQIRNLRQDKVKSVEELSAILEPLAQAMAALTEETHETMLDIRSEAQNQAETFQRKIDQTTQTWVETLKRAEHAAQALSKAANQTKAMFVVLSMAVGISSALLTSAFWLWLAPSLVAPTVQDSPSTPPASSTAPLAPSKNKSKH